MAEKETKVRAVIFSSAEQKLLMELYEDYKGVITRNGNTVAINRARETAWQTIADRLNASNLNTQKRTGQQVKVKYKNIFQSATKKKTDASATGGGPPPESLTPAEELALSSNRGRLLVEGIEGGTSSASVAKSVREQYVEVMGDSICLINPQTTEDIPDPCFDGPRISRAFDEDTEMPQVATGTENPAGKSEDIRTQYKRKLQLGIESTQLDMEYKKLQIKKIKLEILKLERDVPHCSSIQLFRDGHVDVLPLFHHGGQSLPAYRGYIVKDGTGNDDVTCPIRRNPESFQALEPAGKSEKT
ncbi:uncharacterized protein PAE49_000786 isoform 2-T2 [Odontesthes bonariensis]|uniref:uncharacterized protein LOC142373817 isoform X2 n=1 Tax=Odontesthes bonariensis TaxID=219752 RepID=UPI003F58ED4A